MSKLRWNRPPRDLTAKQVSTFPEKVENERASALIAIERQRDELIEDIRALDAIGLKEQAVKLRNKRDALVAQLSKTRKRLQASAHRKRVAEVEYLARSLNVNQGGKKEVGVAEVRKRHAPPVGYVKLTHHSAKQPKK